MAARIRSRLSRTAASGKPTVVNTGAVLSPARGVRSTSTSTAYASIPNTAALRVLKSIGSPPLQTVFKIRAWKYLGWDAERLPKAIDAGYLSLFGVPSAGTNSAGHEQCGRRTVRTRSTKATLSFLL